MQGLGCESEGEGAAGRCRVRLGGVGCGATPGRSCPYYLLLATYHILHTADLLGGVAQAGEERWPDLLR